MEHTNSWPQTALLHGILRLLSLNFLESPHEEVNTKRILNSINVGHRDEPNKLILIQHTGNREHTPIYLEYHYTIYESICGKQRTFCKPTAVPDQFTKTYTGFGVLKWVFKRLSNCKHSIRVRFRVMVRVRVMYRVRFRFRIRVRFRFRFRVRVRVIKLWFRK